MSTYKPEALKGYSLTRINNDINGDPRYVLHYLAIDDDYTEACKLANKIGGRKYHTKTYGGGIVFQSDNINRLAQSIAEISNKLND